MKDKPLKDFTLLKTSTTILAGLLANPKANVVSKHATMTYPKMAIAIARALIEASKEDGPTGWEWTAPSDNTGTAGDNPA